jgi:predicted RNase H-like HicB family nuclease
VKYTIVIEEAAPGAYSGFLADLHGCYATGGSPEEVRSKLESMLADYVRLKRQVGEEIPPPTAIVCTVDVA